MRFSQALNSNKNKEEDGEDDEDEVPLPSTCQVSKPHLMENGRKKEEEKEDRELCWEMRE